MLPSPPLTEPDVPISSIRFFTGELRSQWRIGGRSGREGEDVASELLRGVSMGACPFDPFAITTSAKCVRLGFAITGRVAERNLTSPPSQIRTGRSRVIRLLPPSLRPHALFP